MRVPCEVASGGYVYWADTPEVLVRVLAALERGDHLQVARYFKRRVLERCPTCGRRYLKRRQRAARESGA